MTSFNTVRRGYDPVKVDEALQRMQQNHSAALQESAEKTVEANRLAAELDSANATAVRLRAEITELTEQVAALESAGRKPLSYADLGPRISSILTLAVEEADELRTVAASDAETLLADAAAEAERLCSAAEQYGSETRSRATVEAARAVENAKREADDLLDHADREASAVRREAEAVYEEQRAKAAAAAADFEKTLAGRRDKATADFAAQMANHERALQAASDKLAAVEQEAGAALRDAHAEADATREHAATEAQQLLDNARISAERIRRDSERELAALTSRRDSITQQLANVRQMLATLGGGADQTAMAGSAQPAPIGSGETDDEGTPELDASGGDAGEPSGDAEELVENVAPELE